MDEKQTKEAGKKVLMAAKGMDEKSADNHVS